MRSMGIVIAVAGVAASTLFSSIYLSLRAATRTRLEEIAAQRGRAAHARVERILSDLDGHSTSVALPRIVANLMVLAGMVHWVTHVRHPGAIAVPGWLEITLGVAASALLLWFFGTVLPNSVSNHAAERTVCAWSWLIRASHGLTGPLRRLVALVDEVVRRLAGSDDRDAQAQLKDELMSVVEEAQEEGKFDQAEADMIEAIVAFKQKTVEQIMTPRTEIRALELTNDLGAIVQFVRKVGTSRIPVYVETLDRVVGIFYVKDLMRWLAGDRSGRPFDLKSILRPALFVPESKTVRELLEELREKQVHLAMVADEYGGTAGLVTIEDVVELIIGDVQDEHEPAPEAPDVVVLAGARSAEIDARSYIDDANDALRAIGAAIPEGEEYDTVAGFVVTTLGRIPAVGESFKHESLVVTVLDAEPARVLRVRVELAPEAPSPEAQVQDAEAN